MPGKVAVIGAGLMGSGIAQVAAQAGYEVVLRDLDTAATERGLSAIRTSYDRFVAKERLSRDDADAALAKITTTTDLEDVGDAEIVVEAVFEQIEAKHEVFRVARPGHPRGRRVGDEHLGDPDHGDRVGDEAAGTRGRNALLLAGPDDGALRARPGHRTSDETLAQARAFAEGVGKTCIVVNRDVAGFVTTRLICALVMEAVSLAETGVASPEDIDMACRLGFGHAMGPLATIDLTGSTSCATHR